MIMQLQNHKETREKINRIKKFFREKLLFVVDTQ